MATISLERGIDAPPEVVWAVVTDPEVYEAVAPNLTSVEIVSGEGVGMVRRRVDTDGSEWTERVTRWDEPREFAVAVDVADSEFHRRLFHRFEGQWTVTERDGAAVIEMRFDYDTKYGPVGWLVSKRFAHRAPSLMERIFDGWEAEVGSRLGEGEPTPGFVPGEG